MHATIVWFRQDLRLHDHPALQAAITRGEPLLLVYVLEQKRGRRLCRAPQIGNVNSIHLFRRQTPPKQHGLQLAFA